MDEMTAHKIAFIMPELDIDALSEHMDYITCEDHQIDTDVMNTVINGVWRSISEGAVAVSNGLQIDLNARLV